MLAVTMMTVLLMQAAPKASSMQPPTGDDVPLPQGASAPLPTGNPGAWVTQSDYPADALRAKAKGVTGFRVIINPQGRVTACSVTEGSGTTSLDEATCRLIQQRAHFRPALDSEKHPIIGAWSGRARWALPRG